MLNPNLQWYYPTSIQEAVDFLKSDIKPYAGGTAILRLKSPNINGFVDLSRIQDLKLFNEHKDYYEIGSMLTFADLCNKITDQNFILRKSLCVAASTLLRNRITIGGSIADAPPWSDLLGPLIALDAMLFLEGENQGKYPIESVLQNKKLLHKSIITKLIVPKKYSKYAFYRCVRVNFDYASFTISIGANPSGNKLSDLSIVIFGNKQRYKKLDDLAARLLNKRLKKETIYQLTESENIEFADTEKGSAQYLKQLFKVNLYREMKKITHL